MFTPTKQQLKELGFKQDEFWEFKLCIKQDFCSWYIHCEYSFIIKWYIFSFSIQWAWIVIYPQSIEDIKTLIRLLNHNN